MKRVSSRIFCGLTLVAFALSSPAMAAKAKKAKGEKKEKKGESAEVVKAPYGMAGCGLGALVVDRNETLPQIGAWLLNSLYNNNTFAMTSGTSNCVESRTETAAMEQEVFVAANLSSLSKEAAQGGGEHLGAFAEVLGCSDDVGAQALGQLSRDRYVTLFGTQDPNAVLDNYLVEIKGNEVLAKDCTRAS